MLPLVALVLAQCQPSVDGMTGFASGTGTAMSTTGGGLSLLPDAGPSSSIVPGMVGGSFDSRVHAFASSVSVERLELRTIYPVGQPLPRDGGRDPQASSGSLSMASNVLLFPFDEASGQIVSNQSPVHLDGVFDGGVTLGVPGVFGRAATFDGGCITLPLAPALEPTSTLTLSAWIRPRGLDGSRAEGIFSKRVDYQQQSQFTFFIWTGNTLWVDLDGENDRINGNTALLNDEWAHVAMVFDGLRPQPQRLRIFVNGVLDVTAPETSATLPTQPTPLVVGCLPNPGGGSMQSFEGEMDEVALFLRALSDVEVNGLYARAASRHQASVRACANATCSVAGPFTPAPPGQPLSLPPTPFAQYRIQADAPRSAPYWATIIEAQLVPSCSDAGVDPGTSDAGSIDAGLGDAGTIDAGFSDAGAIDAGSTDAGSTDAGSTDAGTIDAGSTDAGSTDAGVSDAGQHDSGAVDAGQPPDVTAREFAIGCGCSEFDGRWLTAFLVVAHSLSRRARTRRSMPA